jgi:hypothetical protein
MGVWVPALTGRNEITIAPLTKEEWYILNVLALQDIRAQTALAKIVAALAQVHIQAVEAHASEVGT